MDSEDLPRFTLEEYIAYLKAPQWAKDGCDSEAEYFSELCGKVKSWHDESEQAFKQEKDIWSICYDQIENTSRRAIAAASIMEEAIAASKIPITKNTLLDEIAALYSGQYAPILKALSVPVQPMIALANKYLSVELKLNYWDTLKFDLGVDGFIADMWVLKIYTDSQDPGPFGEEERIVYERIDPRNCFPDPKAKRIFWPAMDYFIVTESLDVGVARNRFKEKARLIDMALAEPDKKNNRMVSTQLLMLPGQKNRWAGESVRQRIQIKECWLHDERLKFRAYEEMDELSGEMQVVIDEDGNVDGQWEPAYPYGRMIVTAADRVVLCDIPNPYWHKGLPFVFCPMSPGGGDKLLSVGKAAAIFGIERKINDIETRVHSYAQSETERPMIMDMGTLPSNVAYYKTSGQSRNIVIRQQGKEIFRPPPMETPQFLLPYLQRLYSYKDQTAGQGGILRGEVAEGAQLSAQAVQGMQGMAMGRLAMQSVYISKAMREVGEKTFWLMRETYRTGLKATVTTPEGEPLDVEWDEETVGNEFFVDVDVAANQPGGQQALITQAIGLKREALVDRAYCLQTIGIEGWDAIDARMKQREIEQITAQGFGRSLGVNVKKAQKADDGPTNKVR